MLALRLSLALALSISPLVSEAHAGPGGKPASVAIDLEALQSDLDEVEFVSGATTPTPVLTLPANHAINPSGISIIRGGNHKITKGTGQSVKLTRAVAGDGGSVLVTYRHNTGNLLIPRIRKVAQDNTTAFDVSYNGNALAGIAPDGAGGLYFAQSFESTANGGHQFVQSRVVFRRYGSDGAVLWESESPNFAYPDGNAPEGAASFWVTTVASPAGMTAGYAYAKGTLPGIERRNNADGALVFRAQGLKKASNAARGQLGTMGAALLQGRVRALVPVADGSVLASVDGHVIRVDGAGVQTHAIKCDGAVRAVGGDTMVCAKATVGVLKQTHYGVDEGKLVVAKVVDTTLPQGWTLRDAVDVGAGKRVYVGETATGKLAVALAGSSGAILATKVANGEAGNPGEHALIAGAANGDWMVYVQGETQWLRVKGTYSACTTAAQGSAQQ